MKRNSIIFLMILTIGFSSCKKEECNTCVNNSSFDGTKCNCIEGYEGANCEKEVRTKFIGFYTGNLVLNSANERKHSISLVNNSIGLMKIAMENVTINIIPPYKLAFEYQKIKEVSSGLEFEIVSGTGNLKKDSLFLDYNIKFQGKVSNYKFSGKK